MEVDEKPSSDKSSDVPPAETTSTVDNEKNLSDAKPE